MQVHTTQHSAPLALPVAEKAAPSTSLRSTRSYTAARASDAGGNKPNLATSLGAFPGTHGAIDTVGKADPDYYKITIANLSNFTIRFRNRSQASLALALTDDLGNLVRGEGIIRTIKAGKSINQIYKRVPAGTYYLSVKSSSSGDRYRLTVSATNQDPNAPDCGCGG